MKEKTFYLLIATITLFSFYLRFIDYDKVPPIDEAFDQVHYAWGGATWIKEGVPRSWSNFESYKNVAHLEKYGINWRIVSPLIEKPPLYFLLSGMVVTLSKPENIFSVSHNVIRILPLLLSLPTIFLTTLLARKTFNRQIGILAALIFATTPAIILANRMSLTENSLTPLALISLLIVNSTYSNKIKSTIFLGILSILAILTKQIGATIAVTTSLIFLQRKQFRNVFIVLTLAIIGFVIYLLFGAFYDLKLFLSLQRDVRIGHTLSGVPEMIADIFRFPIIGPKNHPFLDGTMLLGYIILFASPLWLVKDKESKSLERTFLIFPFIYLLFIALGESGATAFTFFGWYLYPLFPFLSILVAKVIYGFWQKPTFPVATLISLILGSSAVRFLFLNLDRRYHYLWQYSYILLVFLILAIVLGKRRLAKILMVFLFVSFILINIVTVFNLENIYSNVAINDKSLQGFQK